MSTTYIMSTELEVVIRGSSVQIKATIRDFDQVTLIDPTSHKIEFYDPNMGLIQTYTSPAQVSTGIYTQKYTVPIGGPQGLWTCRWTATDGTYPSIGEVTFDVKS